MARCRGIKNCICEGKSVKERFAHFSQAFKEILGANPGKRRSILKKSLPCFTRLICEACLNILKGNLKLPESHYQKLRPHKRFLLSLSKPAVSLSKKKDILIKKKGGAAFLAALAPIALSALSGFLGQTLAKATI